MGGCTSQSVEGGISEGTIDNRDGNEYEAMVGATTGEEASPLEFNPSASPRPTELPFPPPPPVISDTITDIKLEFQNTMVVLTRCITSLDEDDWSLSSESIAFTEAHWAALGLPATSTAEHHVASEVRTIPTPPMIGAPGSRFEIVTRMSTVVPGKMVRRARLIRSDEEH